MSISVGVSRRTATLALALLFTLTVPGVALAADGPGTGTVRKANATLTSLLRQKAEPGSAEEKRLTAEVTAKLGTFLDIDELGRRALADHWEKLTGEQRTEFTKLLRGLVESSYVRALRSQLQYEVHYLSEKPKDDRLLVTTELQIQKKDRRQVIGVDYLLHRDGDAWRVYDLITDGVGLVENYRAQFNKVIAKEGFPGLLERMKKKMQG